MANAISIADKVKSSLAIIALGAGVYGTILYTDYPLIARLGFVLGGLIIAAGIFWTTAPGKQFVEYTQDAIEEAKKVIWPTRKETIQTTIAVFVFIVVMAIFLWIVDATLFWLVEKLIGRR